MCSISRYPARHYGKVGSEGAIRTVALKEVQVCGRVIRTMQEPLLTPPTSQATHLSQPERYSKQPSCQPQSKSGTLGKKKKIQTNKKCFSAPAHGRLAETRRAWLAGERVFIIPREEKSCACNFDEKSFRIMAAALQAGSPEKQLGLIKCWCWHFAIWIVPFITANGLHYCGIRHRYFTGCLFSKRWAR